MVLTQKIEHKFTSGLEKPTRSVFTCDEERPGVGVDGGEPGEVLAHLQEGGQSGCWKPPTSS